ncbi:MAG: hypothetical protein MJ009_00680 [Paludibacteraceae bacterium]|nr:hypothetical protein [Paludibacteraceae bacterium]
MNTQYISPSGVEFRLKCVTIAPYRNLSDSEKIACQRYCWKHSDGCRMFVCKNLSDGGEACFGFEVYISNCASAVERCRHFFSKLKTAAFDYINISTVRIIIAL